MNYDILKEKIILLVNETTNLHINSEQFIENISQLLYEAKSSELDRKEVYQILLSIYTDFQNDIPETIADSLLSFMDVLSFWCHPNCYIWPNDELQ